MTAAASSRSGYSTNLIVAGVAIILVAPLIALFALSMAPALASSPFSSDVGWIYVRGTLALAIGAGGAACLFGVGAAMLVSLADFPGRRLFEIALVLPFAAPAYILAYVFADWFAPFGALAGMFGAQNMPAIRSLPGAIIVLAIATYPYIYLTTRASLLGRGGAYFDAARSLGANPLAACRRVALGMNRPAILGGTALAVMEIIADYGAAEHYGIQTLSVGIFRQWHGAGDLTGATHLALSLFLIAALLVLLEDLSRRGRRAEGPRSTRPPSRITLKGRDKLFAWGFLSSLVALGFVLPTLTLISKLSETTAASAIRGLQSALINTSAVAVLGALIACAIASALVFMARASRSKLVHIGVRLASLGYAAPGAVIAIGVLALSAPWGTVTSTAAGGLAVLIYAYVVRFLTAGYNATASGFENVSPQLDDAARSLGASPTRVFTDVHAPMTRGAILTGGAIIALDIAKELPATLLLRPFNFETLATHIYRLASDERLADAAPAALTLLIFGTVMSLTITLSTRASHSK